MLLMVSSFHAISLTISNHDNRCIRRTLISPSMRFLRRNRYFLIFAVLLFSGGVMVLRQMAANQSAHVDLREAFILLQAKGYKTEAQRLFQRLLAELERLPNKGLAEDYQRTQMLVDPTRQDPENLIWKYHWTVSNELEKRSESTLVRALKLARDR
jgi:hypothetical protein